MTDTTDAGPLDAAQVERLNIVATCDTDSAMRHFAYAYTKQSPEGDYVRYSDFAALSQQLSDARAWKPIETYDREKGETATLLDWFTYRTDPDKKPNPVRYVGAWSAEHEAWFDDDGMDLDIDPTHWLPLPNVPEGGR